MKKLITLFLAATLTACGSFEQFMNDAVDTTYIIKANESITQTVLKADLTQQERQIVYDAEQAMLDLGDYLGNIKSPSDILMLDGVIEVTAAKYRQGKTVGLNHQLEYELYDWEGLVALDTQLSAMYERYQEFKSKQKYTEAAEQLGEYAKLGLKVAVILGG